ncbi:NigD-like protein [Prolixibacteraceae bacterium Z1-6]|uniref:NigD-like protein n=1 Tax=Draconibacterium aestuarii TaxID=2998507 RepID=A0A9X3F5E2_9BACT|nr:NigD-like protein [Prolixibacteraceae bacterium Z1-6]
MKKIVVGIAAVMAFVFTACLDDDGYSLGDMWVGFGVLKGEEPGSYLIFMDSKDVLVPTASNQPGWQEEYESGDRVLVNYTILEEDATSSIPRYYVKVNRIENVLMKGIMDITTENEDSIGNDPIIVQDYWVADSLLSFKLKYWGYDRIHFLNLVKQPGDITEEDQPIQLELRHNANQDAESVPYSAFVSFSLNSLRIEGLDSVRFEFTSTDYDGIIHTEEGVFNYSDLE